MSAEIDAWLTKLAGVAGAMASLVWIRGPWPERVMMAVGGALVSYYASPWAAARTNMPEGLSGFLLGLFGMAVCAKVWEVVQSLPIAEVWQALIDALKRRLGG